MEYPTDATDFYDRIIMEAQEAKRALQSYRAYHCKHGYDYGRGRELWREYQSAKRSVQHFIENIPV